MFSIRGSCSPKLSSYSTPSITQIFSFQLGILMTSFILISVAGQQSISYSAVCQFLSLRGQSPARDKKEKNAEQGKSDLQCNSCSIKQEQPSVQLPNGKYRYTKTMALLLSHLICSTTEIFDHPLSFIHLRLDQFSSPAWRLLRQNIFLSLLDSPAVSNSTQLSFGGIN